LSNQTGLLKAAFCCKWVIETLLRLVGPIFVVLAITLLLGVTYVFFLCVCFFIAQQIALFPQSNSHTQRAILPYHVEAFTFVWWLHIAFDAFLAQGVAWNYLMAIFTPPGSPAKLVCKRCFAVFFFRFFF
jgi:hypothetical protein